MKKGLKIILIVAGVFVLCLTLDIVSIYTRNKPIFAISNDYDNVNKVYRGLFYDTYNCFEYSTPQIKAKWTKCSCSVNANNYYKELNDINDRIIEYFQSDNVEYDNLSFNYVDTENKVVVVGLLNNSKEYQDSFKRLVVNSDLIVFVQGEKLFDDSKK